MSVLGDGRGLGPPALEGAGVNVSVQLNLYSVWAEIALDEAVAATAANAAEDVWREFRCGLKAITAVAFSLEGLKKHIEANLGGIARPLVSATGRTTAAHYCCGLFQDHFGITLDRADIERIVEVFELRHSIAHHTPSFRDPSTLPDGTGVPADVVAFRSAVAADAVLMLLRVIEQCGQGARGDMDLRAGLAHHLDHELEPRLPDPR